MNRIKQYVRLDDLLADDEEIFDGSKFDLSTGLQDSRHRHYDPTPGKERQEGGKARRGQASLFVRETEVGSRRPKNLPKSARRHRNFTCGQVFKYVGGSSLYRSLKTRQITRPAAGTVAPRAARIS